MIEYSGEEKMIAFRTRLITGTVTRTDVELKQQQKKYLKAAELHKTRGKTQKLCLDLSDNGYGVGFGKWIAQTEFSYHHIARGIKKYPAQEELLILR